MQRINDTMVTGDAAQSQDRQAEREQIPTRDLSRAREMTRGL